MIEPYSKEKQTGGSRVKRKLLKQAEKDLRWREVCQAIDRRDHHTCRICGRYSSPLAVGLLQRSHRHHLYANDRRCGVHETSRIATLCATCHDEVENSGKVRLEGNADARAAESGKLCGLKLERLTESGWRIVKWC
jgi:5-methylcytosine-specific restriction endonuclease McrA